MSEASDEKKDSSEVKNEVLSNEHYSNAASVLTSKLALIAGTTLGEGCDVHDFENGTGEDCLPVDLETQARLEALLEAAGIGKLSTSDGKALADPDVLHRLTSTVSYALDEAAAALSRLRAEAAGQDVQRTLPEACSDGDVVTVRRLLDEGRSVHETTEDGESLLSLACSAGYFELTEVLLSMSANIEERGPKGGCTPLMEAASGGYKDIVELLIEHGADLDATSSTGNTALTFACCGGYDEIVKILIAAGADLEVQNENGHTPLMEAASGGHVSVAATLLHHGAGINTHSNEFKESALTLACYKGHLEMVQFLLQAGADQEHKTDEMHTALMEASMDGHVDVARLLLDSGAQVNMPADSFESPLTLAACGGHVELASLLLLRGANIEEVNDEGYTPLMEASREGHDKMVIVLLTHGANVNILTDETQETALTLAACGGFLECCSLLIHAGADLEGGCSTPLMEAAQEGHLDLVKFLLEKGAKVDAQTSSGNTALSYACEHGRTSVAAVLLQAGACLEHESEGGRTPLMKAARAGHLCTVQYLISRGANVNKKTRNNDHTVLSLACVYGHVSVVELLLCLGADPTCMLKDGSTMLLEAAKGGHTNVVQLLLDYPKNFMNASLRNHGNAQGVTVNSPSPEQPIPRVPTQTLPLIVPPQEPDTAPFDQNFSGKTSEPMFQTAVATTLRESEDFCGMKKISRYLNPEASAENEKSSSVDVLSDQTSVNVDHDESTDDGVIILSKADTGHSGHAPPNKTQQDHTAMPVNLPSAGVEQSELTKLEQRIKKAIETNARMKSMEDSQSVGSKINSMCADEDLQLLKKQRILEELQKVEQGLQEKATRQLKMKSAGFEYLDFDACCSTARGHPDGGDGLNDLGYVKDDEQSSTSDEDGNSAADDSSMTSPPLHDFLESLESKQQEASDELAPMDNEMVSTPTPFSAENLASMNNVEDMSNIPGIDIDCCTESNNDTPLTLACAGGHRELVHLLISRGANLEHRDKKGFSPLILAATAGHVGVVRTLLDAGADIELQCVRTKDTPLSLACSGGRLEVVELLLERGANIEHRNVSDYTPLSLAASGGYVRIISLLLSAGAEINSRTGSKLGISPLMLAAMNGHTDAVHLLLDAGADINAQIETNRNTALTLACFQGRHAVVSLLVDRRANVEHRAKTGLTPLMEAASGGYAEVGRVLLEKGADVNAAPVPSSRDTALTIAADKGHLRFCELVLSRWAMVDVRNKKGNTPFWLACNGGHLDVAKLLMRNGADLNTADNRNITPLMAAFRKGHIKVVRWLSKGVSQFPSDAECMRYNATITDGELLKRCRTCMECIVAAKERQAQEANKYASELLEEIDKEKSREENRKERAARKREKRRKKRKEKQQLTKQEQNNEEVEIENEEPIEQQHEPEMPKAKPVVDKDTSPPPAPPPTSKEAPSPPPAPKEQQPTPSKPKQPPTPRIPSCHSAEDVSNRVKPTQQQRPQKPAVSPQRTPGRKPQGKKDEEWKEVVRNSRSKKIVVSSSLISRVIGRGGCNIKAIREATAAHIDINKHRKGLERTITIRGPAESIRYANELISELIKDKNSDCDIQTLIQSMQRCKVQTPKPQNVLTNHQPASNDAPVQSQSPKTSPPASAKTVSKTNQTAHRRSVKPKDIPAAIVPEIEKNVQEKFPRTSTPGVTTSLITTLSVKPNEATATVPPPIDVRNTAVPITLSTDAATVPTQPIAVAPLPFMTRPTGKPINRPVQPVAPMISLKTSPYKPSTASVPASHPPFTTAGYSPVNSQPTWQSSMRTGMEHQHQRAVQPIQQFDAARQTSSAQSSNLYAFHDRPSEVNASLMTPGGNYSTYSAGGNQQQTKPSMWDQNPQTDSSLAPGNPPQQLLPINNIQSTESQQQQQDRKIRPIGTERANIQRRMQPDSNANNHPGVWSIHDQNSFATWTSANNTQNPIWSQGVNSVPLGNRVTPFPNKQHLDEGQFGNVGNGMMNAPATIRPEMRDMINHGPNFYQQQSLSSGVGTQPPIGSHLGSSAIDSATRSMQAVAPQQMMGAFKQQFGNHVPDHLRQLMGMSGNAYGHPPNSFMREEHRRDGNSNPVAMLQEQYPRFPMQNSAYMTDRGYVDRLHDVENVATFPPQNPNLIQKDMSMFQLGVRQPNVPSSQQKTNEADQNIFAGASGSVAFPPTNENTGWWQMERGSYQ